MTHQTNGIHIRPDGSIDIAHYIARGRRARGDQAHHLARRFVSPLGGLLAPWKGAGKGVRLLAVFAGLLACRLPYSQ